MAREKTGVILQANFHQRSLGITAFVLVRSIQGAALWKHAHQTDCTEFTAMYRIATDGKQL